MALDTYVFGTKRPFCMLVSYCRAIIYLDSEGSFSYNLIDTKMTKRQTDGYEDKAPSRR